MEPSSPDMLIWPMRCMKKEEVDKDSAVVIVDLNPIFLGVVVDSVNQVLPLAKSEVSPPPDVESGQRTEYVTGVARKDNKLILILDIGKALDVDDYKTVKEAAEKAA